MIDALVIANSALKLFISCFFGLWLWGVSRPGGGAGAPRVDLSEDYEAGVSAENLTPHQLLIERVIIKTFKHYHTPLDISDTIRDSFRLKLWRMGKLFRGLKVSKPN